MNIQPVILSGGSGTRLWPLSRECYPKQLLPLIEENTMLQATALRIEEIEDYPVAPPMVICNEEYRFIIAEQLRQMQKPGLILLEPIGRNTAPALTLAALEATRNTSDAILLVMPADHVILDTVCFRDAVAEAARLAEHDVIVTFGIAPDCAETGYGYIQQGAEIDLHGGVAYYINRFVEKPDANTAQSYLDEGSYLWNSGLFIVKASLWLKVIADTQSEILLSCQKAWSQAKLDGDFIRIDADAFAACPSDSIDYAVMEHLTADNPALPKAAVIPLFAGWSDVGAWDSLWKVLPKNETGLALRGDVLAHDCKDVLAISESRLVACVGLTNIIVVETADAVLVVHKDQTQHVKKIVELLKNDARSEGQLHRKVFRTWGWYDSVDAGERFQVKRITVNPGASLSLQMHHHRAEHWIVVTGTAKVTRGDEVFLVSENQSTFIPLGTKHRLENPGKLPLEMIEVQSGTYLGEDDIVRFTDVYGRNT